MSKNCPNPSCINNIYEHPGGYLCGWCKKIAEPVKKQSAFELYWEANYEEFESGDIVSKHDGYKFPLSVTKAHIKRTWTLRRLSLTLVD